VTIAAWLRRYPDFTAAPGALEHRRSIVLRGLTALPLQLRSGT
jgi:hypothetical protein